MPGNYKAFRRQVTCGVKLERINTWARTGSLFQTWWKYSGVKHPLDEMPKKELAHTTLPDYTVSPKNEMNPRGRQVSDKISLMIITVGQRYGPPRPRTAWQIFFLYLIRV